MIAHLAAYDPGLATPTGDYWVWRSAAVDKAVLERLYAEIHRSHAPSEPNQLASGDLHGGCLARGEWAALYRYFDGGRDRRGRPGRFVFALCLVPRSAIVAADCSSWFDEGPLASENEVEVAAGASPVQPNSLDPDLKVQTLISAERSYDDDQHGATTLLNFWKPCAALTNGTEFHWKMMRKAGEVTSELESFDHAATPKPAAGGRRDSFNSSTIRQLGESTMKTTRQPSSGTSARRSWHLPLGLGVFVAVTIGVGLGGAYIQHRYQRPFRFQKTDSVVVDVDHLRVRFTERQVPTNGIVSFTKQEVDDLFAEIRRNGLAQRSELGSVDEHSGTKTYLDADRTAPPRDLIPEAWRRMPEQPRARNDEKSP